MKSTVKWVIVLLSCLYIISVIVYKTLIEPNYMAKKDNLIYQNQLPEAYEIQKKENTLRRKYSLKDDRASVGTSFVLGDIQAIRIYVGNLSCWVDVDKKVTRILTTHDVFLYKPEQTPITDTNNRSLLMYYGNNKLSSNLLNEISTIRCIDKIIHYNLEDYSFTFR